MSNDHESNGACVARCRPLAKDVSDECSSKNAIGAQQRAVQGSMERIPVYYQDRMGCDCEISTCHPLRDMKYEIA